MMPRSLPPRPDDDAAETCRARAMADGVSWDNFRRRMCGQRWWAFISAAYHYRCVYCDHNPARTIDHVKPKTRSPKTQYSWNNWRAACSDCNRLKGTQRVFDPATEDPRTGLVFDLDTGAVRIRSGVRGNARIRARACLELGIDHVTFNDARRVAMSQFLILLINFLEKRATREDVLRHLGDEQLANRSILRDLILEREFSRVEPIL